MKGVFTSKYAELNERREIIDKLMDKLSVETRRCKHQTKNRFNDTIGVIKKTVKEVEKVTKKIDKLTDELGYPKRTKSTYGEKVNEMLMQRIDNNIEEIEV